MLVATNRKKRDIGGWLEQRKSIASSNITVVYG
jgi:hypothetical protein